MFRLAHISDIHLGPLPDLSYRELASKRITGYVNWKRNRKHLLNPGVTEALMAGLAQAEADHLAVTGDLVNLALDAEIELAREWLTALGRPDDVSVVPGNHDAYVPGALVKSCRAWRPWITGEKTGVGLSEYGFPYLRVRGDVALIGVSSARATGPFMALGHFGATQAARLGHLLRLAEQRGLFRVIMIHHPPVRGATSAHKRLYGIGLFQRIVRRHGVELVLHGHTHLPTLHHIPARDGPAPVVGVTSASQGLGGKKPAAQFNLFEIGGRPGAWTLNLTRKGVTGAALALREIERTALLKPLQPAAK
ncbi:metallophosphoesterase [Nitratireductor sp. StC3]|uniref:metallophosphoesterase family protein n=1 Tax=Nitratireductor sp. StC3 TaxID=2126741 RepID=UPI000D0D28CE|nr:metallophosphoesterase [Nitratireductor sp. StC3]PSM18642.1 metallophosphatase [Nitratireductor sp. StC3]